MPLITNIAVLSPQALSNDSAASTQTKLNANATLAKTESDKIEGRLENSLSYLCGEGFLTLPVVTSSSGSLQITFTACKVLIGCYLALPAGAATLLASQTSGVLYLNNDLTFSTTIPTTKSYMIFGSYVTTGSGVTTFTLSSKLLIPKLVTVTDTVADINIPESPGYTDVYVDHSDEAVFEVDGKLKLTVTPATDFYVQELYTGGMVDETSGYEHTPPHQRTDGGFSFRCTRRAGYYYADQNDCTVTYSRSGLAIAE